MRKRNRIQMAVALITACYAWTGVHAQTVNIWRGNEIKSNWTDAHKWKLRHVPSGNESVHFRDANSVVAIDSTIDLDNSVQLYGQELSFEGHGNINLWSPIPHKSTVFIPASATGYANLTISDTLSINGQIALAAKPFVTSESKGTVTLKNRTTIEGKLSIGNNGTGSGKVFIRDDATYKIAELEINTFAAKGGSAEIHILGGTALLDTRTDPFPCFMEDSSRKIILGDTGTLRINSDWPSHRKQTEIIQMISNRRIVAARGCKINTPIIQDNMILVKAERTDVPQDLQLFVAALKEALPAESHPASAIAKTDATDTPEKTPGIADLFEEMRTGNSPENTVIAQQKMEQSDDSTYRNPAISGSSDSTEKTSTQALSGYTVLFSALLLLLRPAKNSK